MEEKNILYVDAETFSIMEKLEKSEVENVAQLINTLGLTYDSFLSFMTENRLFGDLGASQVLHELQRQSAPVIDDEVMPEKPVRIVRKKVKSSQKPMGIQARRKARKISPDTIYELIVELSHSRLELSGIFESFVRACFTFAFILSDQDETEKNGKYRISLGVKGRRLGNFSSLISQYVGEFPGLNIDVISKDQIVHFGRVGKMGSISEAVTESEELQELIVKFMQSAE